MIIFCATIFLVVFYVLLQLKKKMIMSRWIHACSMRQETMGFELHQIDPSGNRYGYLESESSYPVQSMYVWPYSTCINFLIQCDINWWRCAHAEDNHATAAPPRHANSLWMLVFCDGSYQLSNKCSFNIFPIPMLYLKHLTCPFFFPCLLSPNHGLELVNTCGFDVLTYYPRVNNKTLLNFLLYLTRVKSPRLSFSAARINLLNGVISLALEWIKNIKANLAQPHCTCHHD